MGIKVTVAGALWLVKHQLITLLALNYISPHLASPVGSATLSETRYIMKPVLPQANCYKQRVKFLWHLMNTLTKGYYARDIIQEPAVVY